MTQRVCWRLHSMLWWQLLGHHYAMSLGFNAPVFNRALKSAPSYRQKKKKEKKNEIVNQSGVKLKKYVGGSD